MKTTIKRMVASLLVAVMLFGCAPLETLTGLDFGSLFKVEAEAAGEEIQYCMFPLKSKGKSYVNMSRSNFKFGDDDQDAYNYSVSSSSRNPTSSHHYSGYAFDFCGGDKKLYAPFTGTVYIAKDNTSTHGIYFTSNGPVVLANGEMVDRVTILLIHDDDISNLKDGDVIEQGEYFYDQGTFRSGKKGQVALHVHIEVVVHDRDVSLVNRYDLFDDEEYGRQADDVFYVSEGANLADITWLVTCGKNAGKTGKMNIRTVPNYPPDPYYSQIGWVCSDYYYYVTQKGGAPLRYQPKDDSTNVIATLPQKAKIVVLGHLVKDLGGGKTNQWLYVEYTDETTNKTYKGYLYKNNASSSKEKVPEIEFTPMYQDEKGVLSNLDGRLHKKGTKFFVVGELSSHFSNITKITATTLRYSESTKAYDIVECVSEIETDCSRYHITKAKSNEKNNLNTNLKFMGLNEGYYRFMILVKTSTGEQIIEDAYFQVSDSISQSKDGAAKKPSKINITQMTSEISKLLKSFSEVLKNDVLTPSVNTTYLAYAPEIEKVEVIRPNLPGGNTGGNTTPAPAPVVKTYYPGHYRVTASLNIRTGPGSSYAKATSAIPNGTEIGITEVSSNGWGKTVYRGVTGWVSLNYCTYLNAFAPIQKPGTVTVNYNSDKDFAAGSIVNVSWNAINYADAYNVYLKKSDGTLVKSQTDVRGTGAYFTVDEAGVYYITVAAINSQHVGDESAPTATFTAHAPCTVTFVDWDGRTEVRTVKYGEAATAPLPPTREGYIFKGWDKSFDHVTSDITVKADYQIIEYSVKFIQEVKNSETGKTEQIVLDNQKVKYGEAATPPADVQPNDDFHVFAGWNTDDYKCVKSSLTVKAVFQWENASLPVGISNVKTTRVIGGYAVELDVSCTDASYKIGRIIVSLKTAEGKQIVTTESAAFSLPSDTQSKKMDELFVPTDEPATVAEIYVVESFGKTIPISKVVKSSINMNDEWSGWTDKEWPDNTYDKKETRTLYSYQILQTEQSSSSYMAGWTHVRTSATTPTYGSSYNFVAAVNTDAHKREVSTYNENVYSTWYRYSHYTNGGYNVNSKKNVTWACAPWYGNTDDGLGPTNIGPHYYESASPLAYQTSTTWNIRKYNASCSHTVSNARYSCQKCLNTWFYNETPFQKVTGSRTRYDYKDTYYTYYFEKWSDWSSWTDVVQTPSATKKVTTKPQYRYKMNGLGIENNEGVARVASTVSAGLTENDILLPNLKEFAGKAVVLYIYKYGEASDWTGEYIGQQTIDADGNYIFNFKLREEPTAETGDYVVSIGIEGCNDTITVGKIIAPKPEYKVVFKYRSNPADNTSEFITLDEQIIKEGDAAVAPEHVEFEGYKFLGWNTDLSYITEDTMFVQYGNETEEKIITFEAKYEPEEYVVVFVDWDNDSLVMKRYKYGENIVAPIIKTAEGYQALWEGLDMENPVVTGDTVITAKHTKKTYEVNFYNYDGEIIDTQTVEYGSTASDVNIGEKDNYIFVDWEYTEDLFDNAIVEGDTIYAGEPVVNFYPVYVFDESVEDPVSSLENGTYSEAQTIELTTETEGAVIYYTLDGTDPKTAVNDIDQAEKVFEYTGPITLNRSATLKYYACAFEKNDSEVMTNYYAINAGQTESEWMLYEDLPEYVTENEDEYEISSATGYRYKETITSSNYADIANYEAQGWENVGFEYGAWSDWLMEEPDLGGMAYESETMQPEPELEVRYQYTRYKYLNASGEYAYSPAEVNGVECELETLLLETKLATAGYLSGTTTKYYNYNGEKWFNYGLAEVEVVPDYMMFRYRLKEYTLKKWGAWTLDAPVEGETRENESGEVYKYLIPEMCVVKIVPDYSDFGVETLYYIIEVNEYLTVDEAEYTYEGYDFLGFYTDSEFTKYFNHKTTPVSGEMTLYPKYKAHEFTVIFVDYDGSVLLEETVEYGQSASALELDEIERNGYVFIGWDYEGLDFVTEDIIATAQYVDEDEYCTVSLNYGKYNMMAGNSFQLVATVAPEDTENPNVIWYSTDESVITVTDEGFVTAVGEGQASVVVETESTGMIDECVITVASNPSESLCLNYSSALTLDKENALLRGVTNSVWTASAIKQEFMNEEEDMQIVDINGNVLADDEFVGTGSVIKFMNGEAVLDEVYIVVTGDMNGDGYVNNRDAAMITRYLVEKETADFCQMVAIDVNGDGFVNNRDASMVSRYLVGKETL